MAPKVKKAAAGLQAGDAAPAFSLPADDGSTLTLAALRGKKVVLYFYPRDNTPGCTREACGFRDAYARFRRAGAVVLGVSKDSLASHGKFKEKYALPFTLLSDADTTMMQAYGAWGEKSLYGRKFMGILRTTYVIDEKGKVKAVFPRVKPDGHAEAVLAAL
jgi:peroxiredoxin Q/BCP